MVFYIDLGVFCAVNLGFLLISVLVSWTGSFGELPRLSTPLDQGHNLESFLGFA